MTDPLQIARAQLEHLAAGLSAGVPVRVRLGVAALAVALVYADLLRAERDERGQRPNGVAQMINDRR